MENKAPTKTPIPTRSGFRNFALCTLIFAFSISLPSTLVETSLQISLFFCKTNPILTATKPMQPPLPQRFTKANHPWPLEENEPNRTQTNPIYPNAKMTPNLCPEKHYGRIFPLRLPAKRTQLKPISVSAARFIVYKWSTVPEGPIHRFAARESRIERRDTKYEM
jgi:hypothetical protein